MVVAAGAAVAAGIAVACGIAVGFGIAVGAAAVPHAERNRVAATAIGPSDNY